MTFQFDNFSLEDSLEFRRDKRIFFKMIYVLLKLAMSLYTVNILVDGFLLQMNYLAPPRPTLTEGSTYNLTCKLHDFNIFIKANYTTADIVFAKNGNRIPTNSSDIFVIEAVTAKLQIHAPAKVNQTLGLSDHYYCYVFDNGHLSHIVGQSIVDYRNRTAMSHP